jgi:hypothetical protein
MGDWQGVRALLGGPVIYMIFVGALAIVVLMSALIGRLNGLFVHMSRAADRLQQNFVVNMGWGTGAVVVTAIIGIRLLQLPPHTRLLGVLVMLLLLAFGGTGLGVAALTLGRTVTLTAKAVSDDDLAAARLGLSIFLASEFVPVAGWIVVFFAGCAGSAALLGSIFQKQAEVIPADQI